MNNLKKWRIQNRIKKLNLYNNLKKWNLLKIYNKMMVYRNKII